MRRWQRIQHIWYQHLVVSQCFFPHVASSQDFRKLLGLLRDSNLKFPIKLITWSILPQYYLINMVPIRSRLHHYVPLARSRYSQRIVVSLSWFTESSIEINSLVWASVNCSSIGSEKSIESERRVFNWPRRIAWRIECSRGLDLWNV